MRKSNVTKKKVLKYYINGKNLIFSIIISIILAVVYAYLVYQENFYSLEILKNTLKEAVRIKYEEYINWYNIGESFIVLVVSITLSSIITALIGIKENNHIYSDLITNDVFASEDFYMGLSEENKSKIIKNLEQHIYFNGSKAKSNMFTYMKEKLDKTFLDGYYYKECHYDINCTIYENYIEKSIVKTVEILSIKDTDRIKGFLVASSTYKKDDTYDALECVYVKINGQTIDKNKYIEYKCDPITDLDKKNGYDENKRIVCNKNLDISSRKSQKLEVEYITRVPINDTIYVSRLKHASKEFSFKFNLTVKNGKNYIVSPAAFGFVDDASESPMHADDNKTAIIKFKNWMFPHDGVSISIIEK